MKKILLILILLTLGISFCSRAEIGQSCEKSGDTEECVDKAICTQKSSGNVCYKICTSDADCSSSEACNGISGSNQKSCQPK